MVKLRDEDKELLSMCLGSLNFCKYVENEEWYYVLEFFDRYQMYRFDTGNYSSSANLAYWLMDKLGTDLFTAPEFQGFAISIPRGSFSHLNIVDKIVIPEGIEEIESNSFEFSNISEIILPESLKRIGPMAFKMCSNLKSIVIPEGVKEIGAGAFSNCHNLKEVVIKGMDTRILINAFRNSDKVVVKCPETSAANVYCEDHNIPCEVERWFNY